MEMVWNPSELHFCSLCLGEVFYAEGDRRLIYMKVEDVCDPESGEPIFNAVDFSDATLTYFSPGEKVDRVKAKLVLS